MDLIQLTYPNTNSLNLRKKENITQKARNLFSKYGTQHVSMNDIANHCKISKKTIYAFWGSKEILVTEIVKLVLAENSETLYEIQVAALYPTVEIQKLFDFLQKAIKILTPFFLSDLREHYPKVYHLLGQFQDKQVRPFLIQNLKRGINEAVYRSDLDKESLSMLYCWQLQNIYEATSLPIKSYKLLSQTNALFLQSIICNSKDDL
jgi:AcrR family transcriptional regulator